MDDALPPDITKGAALRGNEYGWTVASFPNALTKAEACGYACLGGQFQFRLDDGSTCEMYWLGPTPLSERLTNLGRITPAVHARRSCADSSI